MSTWKSMDEVIDMVVFGAMPVLVLFGVFLLMLIYFQEIQRLLSESILNASALIALFSLSISSLVAAREYRLKVKAEKRLTETSQIEANVRLLKSFTELMDIAEGRIGYITSEKAIEELFEKKIITDADLEDLKSEDLDKAAKAKKRIFNILSIATWAQPIGKASQNAAIAAIGTLTRSHPKILIEATKEARDVLVTFKRKEVEKYLDPILSLRE